MSVPERIASLLASATEILYGLGLGDRVVAVSHECDFPAEVRDKPRATFTNIAVGAPSGQIDVEVRELLAAGSPLYEIDVAQLTALRPDLIVTQAQCDVCAVKYDDVLTVVRTTPALESTRVVALNPQCLDDVFEDIERVGQAVNRVAEARDYVARLRDRVEVVRARTAAIPRDQRPRVLCIEWLEPLMAAANWMPDLIDLAGGVQSLTTSGRHSTYSTWDALREFDPEVIVVMPCGFDLARTIEESRILADLPGWRDVTAVRRGRVYAVDGNAYFNRSGPRLVDSLEILARLVHPRLFGRSDSTIGEDSVWRRL